jgi:predicted Zn-dependent peptidase
MSYIIGTDIHMTDGENIHQLKLKNGIRVIIVPLKTQLTYISVNYLLGRNKERSNEAGLTHYCEHLLGCLTSHKYNNSAFVSEEIYKRGGEFNAFVSDYEMSIYIKGIYDDLEFYMDILSNTINDFYVEDDVKKKEKSIVIQECLGYISNSSYRFRYNIYKFLYPKYSYLADYKKQIKDIVKFDDKKITAYLAKHLNTDNLVLSISCPSRKVNETIANVKKYFGVFKYKKTTTVYPVRKYSSANLKIVNIKNRNADDKNNSFVIHLPKRIEYMSDEYIILYYYLQRILFHFDSGIFYKILRKKLGIIYSIGLTVDADYHNPDMSYYDITSKCHSKYTGLFIENFLQILKDYEIEDERIENAKRHFKYLYEKAKFYSLTSQNDYYKYQVLFGKKILTNKEIYEKTMSLSSHQIKDYYKNVFAKDILARHTLFYYSNKNINKQIHSLYKKEIPNVVCKTHYIP